MKREDKGKLEYAKILGVSPDKLDDLMNDCQLNYVIPVIDKRSRIITSKSQEIIEEYIKTGVVPESE